MHIALRSGSWIALALGSLWLSQASLAAGCGNGAECYTQALQRLQAALDAVSKPQQDVTAFTAKFETRAGIIENDLKKEADDRISALKMLEGKVPQLALAGIEIITDHTDPSLTGQNATIGCDKVGGTIVAGSCVGQTLAAGQAAVGPLFMGSDNQPVSKGSATHIECRPYNTTMPMIAFVVCMKAH